MKLALRAALALGLFAVPGLASATEITKFKAEDFATPKKLKSEAQDLIDPEEFDGIRKLHPKKIAVIEFTIEYVTQQSKSQNVGLISWQKRTNLEFGDALKQALPDQLYDKLVEELTAAGYTVLPKQDVVSHELYQQFVGDVDPVTKRPWVGPAHAGNRTSQAEFFPAEGMMVFPTTGDAEDQNEQTEAKLMEALGADATLRLRVVLGIYKEKYPSIEVLTKLIVNAGVEKTTKKKTGAIEYGFKESSDSGIEHGFYLETDIGASKNDGTVTFDEQKFSDGIMAMYPTFAKMLVMAFN